VKRFLGAGAMLGLDVTVHGSTAQLSLRRRLNGYADPVDAKAK
jgi:hypothetical protein